jgi:Zn-dependent alcohol dehydrogenase
VNTANVQPGSTCAVFGLGTIGLAAIMGCRDAKASKIFAIDINPEKFKIAKELGATDCINPKELDIPIDAYFMQNFGGIENTIECIGSIETMKQAVNSTTVGNGTCILLGVSPQGSTLPVDPVALQTGRTIKGSFYGDFRLRDDIPKLVEDYKKLSLEKFITHKMPLDKINEAFELLKAGKSIRTVITF